MDPQEFAEGMFSVMPGKMTVTALMDFFSSCDDDGSETVTFSEFVLWHVTLGDLAQKAREVGRDPNEGKEERNYLKTVMAWVNKGNTTGKYISMYAKERKTTTGALGGAENENDADSKNKEDSDLLSDSDSSSEVVDEWDRDGKISAGAKKLAALGKSWQNDIEDFN